MVVFTLLLNRVYVFANFMFKFEQRNTAVFFEKQTFSSNDRQINKRPLNCPWAWKRGWHESTTTTTTTTTTHLTAFNSFLTTSTSCLISALSCDALPWASAVFLSVAANRCKVRLSSSSVSSCFIWMEDMASPSSSSFSSTSGLKQSKQNIN